MIELCTDNTQDVTKNGIPLNPISCVVTNKLNAENELEMEILLDSEGLYKEVSRGRLIKVPTPDFDNGQLYRIYDTKKSMSSNTLVIYARHILFDLNKKIIFNKNVQGNGQQVLSKLFEDTNFKGNSASNITDIRQYKMRNITNIINGNEEDSFINIWGGEIECNNFNLNIPLKRGRDNGITVTFGYNLEDIEEEIYADNVVTRIYPYSGELVLSGNTPYVDSPLISKYPDVYEQAIEMSDIKVKEKDENGNLTGEGYDTEEEARTEMIKRCNKLYEEGADKVKANYTVKMHDLSKTIEYKRLGYDVLEKICLGDTVHCYNNNIDISVDARCIGYKWDCINEEYEEIELGQFISGYIDDALTDLDNLYRKIVLTEQYILLQVTSLDNNLSAKIEMTAGQIRSEVGDIKNGLETSITQTATEIRTEVKDTKQDLETSITQTAESIRSEVKKKVDEKDFSSLIEQNADSISLAIKGETNMNVVFNSRGQTIKNGALEIEDNRGNTIMSFDDGLVVCDAIGVDDLVIHDTSKGSDFYNCLANMDELYTNKLSCERLYIEGKHIADYIRRQIDDYLG